MSFHQPTTPPSLEHAYYGTGFVEAVKRAYLKYATFSGRASRSEYWWFVLFVVIVYVVVGGLALAVGTATSPDGGNTMGPPAVLFGIVFLLFILGSIVPSIALSVRRLHDAGYSGLLYLINLVPYLGGFILMVFLAMPTSRLGDRYDPGANPQGYGPQGYLPQGYGQQEYAPYGPGQPGHGQDPYNPSGQVGYGPPADPFGHQGYGPQNPGQSYGQSDTGHSGDAYGQPGQPDPYRPYP